MTQPPTDQPTNLPVPQSTNPYVGPRTFTERDGRFFFGREREARDLTARIVSERLLLFYAQSGAGKSSLLNARVIPRLRDEERFQVLPVGRVSGELPAGVARVDNIYAFNLMTSLDQSGGDPQRLAQVTLSDFLARLARETAVDAAGQRTARWAYKPEVDVERPAEGVAQPAAGGPRFALVIDQFEEIITAHPGRWREREGFFRQLNQALLDDPNLWVVLSLREDYVASLDPYAEMLFNRLRARFYMERMGVAAALEAVRRPAELAGRPFAPGAAEQLVDNLRQVRVAGQETTVPGQYVEPVQLQVVCFRMWENLAARAPLALQGTAPRPEGFARAGGEGEISLQDLAVAGDVNQALAQFYEETLVTALADPAAQGTSERQVRTWFDEQLITPAGTRGLVHQGESETGGLPNDVVRALQRRFLVRGEARGGDAWIELVHDRFVEPIRASNAAWFPLHLSALQRQAALWDEQGRSSGLLLRDAALVEAEAWASANPTLLEIYEREFLAACREARAATERERRQARRIRALAIAAAITAVLAVMALGAAAWFGLDARATAIEADLQKQQAERAARRAQAGELAANVQVEMAKSNFDPSLALLLARQAVSATWPGDGYVTPMADAALQSAISRAERLGWVMNLPLHRDSGGVRSATYSPDGRQIVTASDDGTARIWDAVTGQEVGALSGHRGGVNSAAYSPDGRQIVTASTDGTARIWDATTGQEVDALSGHSGGVNSAAYSPDGRQIVTASDDGTARIWDAATGQEVGALSGHSGGVNSAAYSPDGRQIVTASGDWMALIWDAATGQEVGALGSHSGGVNSAAYSPDGWQIVTASDDGTARIWDAATGQELRNLSGHSGGVRSAAYSPDGRQIVTASDDGTARIWDAATSQEVGALSGHRGEVRSAVYSPDGLQIVTASADGTARIWDAATGLEVRALSGHGDWVWSAAYSPDGRQIVTASGDGTARIWDAATGQEVGALNGHGGWVLSVAYSPDGRQIVTASGDGTARIWDATTGQEVGALSGHSDWVRSAAFSPDGQQIVTASDDRMARIWDAATGQEVRTLSGHSGGVNSAAYSPDGRQIVTASGDQTARIWDAATGQELGALSGHSGAVNSAAYSPDGRQIVTASGDETARIWDAATGQEVGALSGHRGGVNSAAFSPDGRQIVTASDDQMAHIWIASIDDLLAKAARLIQRDPPLLTPQERRRYGLE